MNPAQGKVRVAINGFGRIGRNAFKVALEEHEAEIEIVALNDLTDPKVLAHLLEYDTAYGHWDKDVSSTNTPTTVGSVSSKGSLVVEGQNIPIFAEKDPKALPWKDLNVDVVIESTGRFTDQEGMQQHITAGAKKVVLSAPAKDTNVNTFLIGVNHDKYQGQVLINNASCTSNCLAPVIAIINEKFGIQKALYTTVHSVTAEQNLVDGPPPGGKSADLRRARAAYANMIPTTTGAAVAVTQAIPELEGFMDGRAIRVPTIVGSITDFTVLLKKKVTVEEVNQAFKDACNTDRWKGVVAWTQEPLVSSDIIGRSESSIVDLELTQVVDGDLVKIFAWYDNEWGYSNRLVEQVINVGKDRSQLPAASQFEHQTNPSDFPHNLEPIHQVGDEVKAAPSGFASPQPPWATNSPPEPITLPPSNPQSTGLNPRGFFAQDFKAPEAPTPQPQMGHPLENRTPPAINPATSGAQVPVNNPPMPAPINLPNPAPIAPPTPVNVPSFVQPAVPVDHQNPAPIAADQKADEPKIDDHIVPPEESEHPKNNPFTKWFK